MNPVTSGPALRLGLGSAVLMVVFEGLYAIALILGLSALDAAHQPIRDPYFTIMEVLILLIAPAMVALAIAVHGSCVAHRRPVALAAVVFAAILATITSSVHASILLLSREPAFAGMMHVFSFEWPSVVYALDILAWDYIFGFFAVFLAFSFETSGLERFVRALLLASGVLAFLGLWGAVMGDMQSRNIGIIGYVGIFTGALCLIAVRMAQRMRAREG